MIDGLSPRSIEVIASNPATAGCATSQRLNAATILSGPAATGTGIGALRRNHATGEPLP